MKMDTAVAARAPVGCVKDEGIEVRVRMMWPTRQITAKTQMVLYLPHFVSAIIAVKIEDSEIFSRHL
jgi:hypothetical protein